MGRRDAQQRFGLPFLGACRLKFREGRLAAAQCAVCRRQASDAHQAQRRVSDRVVRQAMPEARRTRSSVIAARCALAIPGLARTTSANSPFKAGPASRTSTLPRFVGESTANASRPLWSCNETTTSTSRCSTRTTSASGGVSLTGATPTLLGIDNDELAGAARSIGRRHACALRWCCCACVLRTGGESILMQGMRTSAPPSRRRAESDTRFLPTHIRFFCI